MLFSDLVESELDHAVLEDVDRLLDLKMNSPETKIIPRVKSLNEYLKSNIEEIRSRIDQMPEDAYHGWEELNQLFLSQLEYGRT